MVFVPRDGMLFCRRLLCAHAFALHPDNEILQEKLKGVDREAATSREELRAAEERARKAEHECKAALQGILKALALLAAPACQWLEANAPICPG